MKGKNRRGEREKGRKGNPITQLPNYPTTQSPDTQHPTPNAIGVIIGLAIGLRLFLLLVTPNTAEDFYITLRYAENLAHGRGLVYNPGEAVLGTTTPLYTLFLALLIRLHVDPILGGKLLNILADGVACGCVARLGRAVSRPGAGLAAALCLAVAPTNLIWAGSGMESSLVAAVGVAAWWAWAEKRERVTWVAAAVLVLLRIDGAALAVVLLLATIARERRIPWRGLLLFGALLLPWFVFATVAFGSPVPTSLKAKLIVYAWRASPGFPNLLPFLRLMTRNPLGAFLAVGVVLWGTSLLRDALVGRDKARSRPDTLLLAPAAWILLHYGSMALSKVFLFGWYFVPPTPLYYLLALAGWSRVGERWRGSCVVRSGMQTAMWAAAAGVALSLVVMPRVVASLHEAQSVEEGLRIPIGVWLRSHAKPTERVMLEPIGYIGYFSGLRVLDTVGLVSPEVLPFYRQEVASPYHELWTRFRPEWVLLRAGEWQALQAYEAGLPESERLEAHHTQVMAWSAPMGNPAVPVFRLFRRIAPGGG